MGVCVLDKGQERQIRLYGGLNTGSSNWHEMPFLVLNQWDRQQSLQVLVESNEMNQAAEDLY